MSSLPPTEPAPQTNNPDKGSAADLRGKYATRMAVPGKDTPAIRIAIAITTVVILIFAVIVFIAVGGPAKLAGPQVKPAPFATVVPTQPQVNPDLAIPQAPAAAR